MTSPIRVTVWNEFRHEKRDADVQAVYPQGMHAAIAEGLIAAGCNVRTATLDEPEHGLTEDVLAETDVLTWWGHMAHGEVKDEIVDRVQQRVLRGMGLIVLHSGHFSKIFKRLMGTTCDLKWREAGEKSASGWSSRAIRSPRAWASTSSCRTRRCTASASTSPRRTSWSSSAGSRAARSSAAAAAGTAGAGRVFYFRPGHETYPIYYQPEIRRVLTNAVRWAAPQEDVTVSFGHRPEPLEQL